MMGKFIIEMENSKENFEIILSEKSSLKEITNSLNLFLEKMDINCQVILTWFTTMI